MEMVQLTSKNFKLHFKNIMTNKMRMTHKGIKMRDLSAMRMLMTKIKLMIILKSKIKIKRMNKSKKRILKRMKKSKMMRAKMRGLKWKN
jgi:hypothetical protein